MKRYLFILSMILMISLVNALELNKLVANDGSMIGYYHLDNLSLYNESDNFIHDFSGLKNNGTIYREGIYPSLVNGYIDNSYQLMSGTGNHFIQLGLTHENTFNFNTTKNYTFMFWIKLSPSDITGNYLDHGLFEIFDNLNSGLTIGIKNYIKVGTINLTNGNEFISSNQTLNNNTWYQVTVVYFNSSLLIYSNSNLTGQGVLTGFKIGIIDRNKLGMEETFDGNGFNGLIDEVIIYNRTLTSTEILNIYNNYTLNNISELEASIDYKPIVYETENNIFETTFLYNQSKYTNSIASFIYNGSSYDITQTLNDRNTRLTRTIDVPSVNELTIYPFYWIINLTNSSGSIISFNTSINNQTVKPINLKICNTTYNQSYINFSILNSVSPYNYLNGIFKGFFEIYLGTGTTKKNYSFSNLTETTSNFSFCALPKDLNYFLDAQIEYESTGYAKNFYYINGLTITNISQLIFLYLLNDTLATLTQLEVVDKSQSPVEDVIIEVQRYDIGTDTYYLVAMAKSNYDGIDIAYLNWYDTLYKFILKQNGTIVKSTNPYKISETPQIFIIGGDITYDYDKFDNIDYSLTFNNNTKNFILTYSSTDSSVKSYCLRVSKRNVLNDTIICDTCEVSSSATLYCNVNTAGNGTFIATFYATGSLRQILSIFETIGVINQLYDEIGSDDGAAYAVILGLIILVVFFVSPALGIIGALIGLVANHIFGFIPLETVTFTGIVIVGGVVIWLLKR